MNRALSACFLIVAIIHLLPLVGVLGAARLATLYGLLVNEPNLEILLRHRAVLFGILGGFFAYAAFRPGIQAVALVIGLVSVVSFLWLAYAVGRPWPSPGQSVASRDHPQPFRQAPRDKCGVLSHGSGGG